MRKYLLIFLILSFFCTCVFGQEEKSIGKIEFIGLKNAKKRFDAEFPVREGAKWNNNARQNINSFFQVLKLEKILDSGTDPKIEEIEIDRKTVNLKITIAESLQAFFVPLPMYKPGTLFKVKARFWLFYVNGYKTPIESYLQWIQNDGLEFLTEYYDIPVSDDKRLKTSLYFKARTTTLNYLGIYTSKDLIFGKYVEGDQLNKNWDNALENINLGFKYNFPVSEVMINPSIGFDYRNHLVVEDPSSDKAEKLTNIIESTNKIIVNPKFEFSIPILQTGMNFGGKLGFAFKDIKALDTKDSLNDSNKVELGFSSIGSGDLSGYPDLINTDRLPAIYLNNIVLPFSGSVFDISFAMGYKVGYETDPNKVDQIISLFHHGIKIKPTINFRQPIPIINSMFSINFGMGYTNLWDTDSKGKTQGLYYNSFVIGSGAYNLDDGALFGVPSTLSTAETNPNPVKVKFDFNLPSDIVLTPSFGLIYSSYWYTEDKTNSIIDGFKLVNLSDTISGNTFPYVYTDKIKYIPAINLSVPFNAINSSLQFKMELGYLRNWRKTYDNQTIERFSSTSINVQKFYLKEFSLSFKKNIKLDEYYIASTKTTDVNKEKVRKFNSLEAKINFYFDEDKPLYATDNQNANGTFYPENFMTMFNFYYQLYLPIYKENVFKFKLDFFAGYNDSKIFYKDTGKTEDLNYLDHWFREDRASKFYYFGGMAGFLANIEFKTLLFTVNMPKFGDFSVDKDIIWDIYWNIYLDFGLSLERNSIDVNTMTYVSTNSSAYSKSNSLTINYNNLHLIPLATLGTSFKFYPRFVPLILNFEASFSAEGILLNNSLNGLTSYLWFTISIEKFEGSSNWFLQ